MGSPSSPKPFVFTGSKSSAPRLRGADTLLTSSPDESFFIPTVAPEEELETEEILTSSQESPAPNQVSSRHRTKSHRFHQHREGLAQRKHSRRGQGRERHRVLVQSTASPLPEVLEIPEASETPEVPEILETPEIPEDSPAPAAPTSSFSSLSSSSFTSPAEDPSSHAVNTKPRVKSNQRKRTKFGKSSISRQNTLNSDSDCSNPFHCPPKSTAP